jgi:hypothetical protein
LVGHLFSISTASATESGSDHPTVWLELGGQFEQIQTGQEAFAPPFFAIQPEISSLLPGHVQIPAGNVQTPLDHSFGGEGAILFQPEDTNWVFSVGVRYGRSNGRKHIHHGTAPQPFLLQYGTEKKYKTVPPSEGKFSDASSKITESHVILDFHAGKDVGLGMFGRHATSTLSAGVRFAQFDTSLNAILGSGPEPFQYKYFGSLKFPQFEPHTFLGEVKSKRSFRGTGPSFSWDASASVAGSADTAELTVDWGLSAALLFGRQKARTQHQTTGFYKPAAFHGNPYNLQFTVYQHGPYHSTRSRSVTVPNFGGMAGVSLKFPNAKVSLGYRADFFFGAMDVGVDARKSATLGFYGPFASVSVGLGG